MLQGLIGEMRKVKGEVSIGGRVAYCPQTAWIQNATLVSCLRLYWLVDVLNATRGRTLRLANHLRKPRYVVCVFRFLHSGLTFVQYWGVVESSSLLPDLQVLADGDLTEVGRVKFEVTSY